MFYTLDVRIEVRISKELSEERLSGWLSLDSPESNQADLNRCTHPWELLKRPGRKKTNEGHKSSESSVLQRPHVLAALQASDVRLHMQSRTPQFKFSVYFKSAVDHVPVADAALCVHCVWVQLGQKHAYSQKGLLLQMVHEKRRDSCKDA